MRRVARAVSSAERAFWKALYGDHPYGQRPSVTTFAQLGQSDANEWIARNYRPANGVLAVVGDIDPQEVQALAQKWFGDWKQDADGSEVPPPPAPSLVPHEPRVVVTHRPGATQGEIRFGCLLPAAAESTEATYDLLAALVVKHLFRTLRQELGVTYGVDGVALELRGGAAHLTVQTAIENAALPTALRLFREHLRALEAGRIDDQELASARWDLARRFNLRFATNRSFAEAILERRTKGWTLASLDRYPARLAEVAASELRSAFATCRITEVLSVIGDEPTVRAALREGWTAGQ